MKVKMIVAAGSALLMVTPGLAQTAVAPASAIATPADPAALAEARLVVARLVPPGVYKTMMGPMMNAVTDNMSESMKAIPVGQLAQIGGLDPKSAAALDKVDVTEVMAIYDPHWQERMRLSTRAMFDAMGDFLSTLEPEMREAMARAYANHFTLAELTDLDRFFATASGAKFASQYMTIASDPAMTAAMKSMMPKMMQHMPEFAAAAEKATASLPPPRKLENLTPAEKARLARALGVDERKLRDPKTTT